MAYISNISFDFKALISLLSVFCTSVVFLLQSAEWPLELIFWIWRRFELKQLTLAVQPLGDCLICSLEDDQYAKTVNKWYQLRSSSGYSSFIFSVCNWCCQCLVLYKKPFQRWFNLRIITHLFKSSFSSISCQMDYYSNEEQITELKIVWK